MLQVGMPHLLVLNTSMYLFALTQPNFSTNKSIYFFHVFFLNFFNFFWGPGEGVVYLPRN